MTHELKFQRCIPTGWACYWSILISKVWQIHSKHVQLYVCFRGTQISTAIHFVTAREMVSLPFSSSGSLNNSNIQQMNRRKLGFEYVCMENSNKHENSKDNEATLGIYDVWTKEKRGEGVLDFTSENRWSTGSWERAERTWQANSCRATQKQWDPKAKMLGGLPT